MTLGKIIPWILVGVLMVLFAMYVKGCFKGSPGYVDQPPQDSSFYWKTKLGDTVTSLRSTIAGFSQVTTRARDSIAWLLGTKADQLQEIIWLRSHGQATLPGAPGKPVIVYVDSGKGQQIQSVSQVFANPWYQVIAEINLQDDRKSQAQVQTFDSLLLVWKTGHTGGLFNRKDYLQLDIKNSNPYNKISGAQAYRAPPPKPKQWGLGIFVGWGYGFNVNQGSSYGYPIVGLGLQRNFIRF